jgi:acetylornithine deacetylase/succinyl-diaminopimelate desuccinylase-like protein
MVAEKGSHWTRLRVRGTPGHGSAPYKSDNAVVKLAEVVRRLAAYRPPAVLDELWKRFIDGLDLSLAERTALKTAPGLEIALGRMPITVARLLHAATHTTFSPNVARGGVKTNIIPDEAELLIDIRTLPGVDGAGVHAMLKDALGDVWGDVQIMEEGDNLSTASPTDTDLWRVLAKVTDRLVPGAATIPMLLTGATDARFFRRKGVTSYGYGLFSELIPFNEFGRMLHGNDERIDQASLRLMLDLWDGVAREMLA